MKDKQSWGARLLAVMIMFLAVGALGYGVDQSAFGRIIIAYGLFFWAYGWQVTTVGRADLRFWLAIAVLLRLALVGAFPSLSDDIYRFVWDGRLWLAGLNPFDELPRAYLAEGLQVPGLTLGLFEQLNSPDYYTIYPPVAQALFWLSAGLFPQSVEGASVVMQVFLLLVEVGTIFLLRDLLRYWSLPEERVLWYALNPLIIVEVVGNLHFEGAMIFFLLLGLRLLLRWKDEAHLFWLFASALAMALAVSSKLLPLLFFPFLLRRLGWRTSFLYFGSMGLMLLLMWWPLYSSAFVANFGSSVDLYFRRFEFNGSLYYALRWIGYQFSGFNLIRFIGPSLAALVFLTIMGYSAREKISTNWAELPLRWLVAIAVYLFCATTVHPWYTALPLMLCLFTNFRWPVLWTALITMTYINYSYVDYHENLLVVALEYGVVLLLIGLEWRKNRQVAAV